MNRVAAAILTIVLILGLIIALINRRTDKPIPIVTNSRPGDNPTNIAGAYSPRLSNVEVVKIEAGSIQTGSFEWEDTGTARTIKLSYFEIDKTEVTNRQYRKFLKALDKRGQFPNYPALILKAFPNGKSHVPDHWDTPKYKQFSPTSEHPVVFVDWYDAYAFACWADKRLPTELEWEKAAGWDNKTHKKRLFPWGDRSPDLIQDLANFGRDSSKGNYELAPVSKYVAGATPDGVLQMGGNVAEWCFDWYVPHYRDHAEADPQGPDSGIDKVIRGGHLFSASDELRTAHRLFVDPTTRQGFIGFRCVD